MAQESWKLETDETECQKPKSPILCVNNCGFFGSAVTNDLCSKCYRDLVMKQQPPATLVVPSAAKVLDVSSSSVPFEPTPIDRDLTDATNVTNVDKNRLDEICDKQPANRCLACLKRVGLAGFKCRCGGTFCFAHRYSETHECSFDYKNAGREAIAKENPVVKADKIEKI